jgi:hypothetical protein
MGRLHVCGGQKPARKQVGGSVERGVFYGRGHGRRCSNKRWTLVDNLRSELRICDPDGDTTEMSGNLFGMTTVLSYELKKRLEASAASQGLDQVRSFSGVAPAV